MVGHTSGSHGKMIGRTVGPYTLESVLGRGGMGTVYLARHAELDRESAVKVLSTAVTDSESALERFRREARGASRVRHPNAITIYDFGIDDGLAYLTMERLEGEELADRLARQGALSVGEFLRIFGPVCQAVHAGHGQGVVHRDIKPSNIFLDTSTGTEMVKVLDFGLARLLDDRSGAELTGKAILGTPHYMAPEQLTSGEIGAWTDVYSLGVLAYRCLTGQFPFDADSDVAIMMQRVLAEVPPFPVLPGVPDAVGQAVERAMSKAPEDRPASALALLADLTEAAYGAPFGVDDVTETGAPRGSVDASEPVEGTPTERQGAPRWVLPVALAAGALLLSALVVALSSGPAPSAPVEASSEALAPTRGAEAVTPATVRDPGPPPAPVQGVAAGVETPEVSPKPAAAPKARARSSAPTTVRARRASSKARSQRTRPRSNPPPVAPPPPPPTPTATPTPPPAPPPPPATPPVSSRAEVAEPARPAAPPRPTPIKEAARSAPPVEPPPEPKPPKSPKPAPVPVSF